MSVVTTAPGKLVLAGEYAVLDGAPAICMAVDRRARVAIVPSDDDHHTVVAPGFSASTGRFRAGNGRFEWSDGGDDFELLRHVWQRAGFEPPGSCAITLDTQAFFHRRTGAKIGVGSSAALAAALARALAAAGDDPSRVAFDAHRRFQDGVGSGADVACSIAGGLIEYTMNDARTEALEWPRDLHFGVVWVGEPANTRERLIRLGRQAKRASNAALVLASRRIALAWRRSIARDVLGEYSDYIDVLREFSSDHDLGIFDAGHAELADAARAAGVVYKPCGAGSGDIGIVFASDPGVVDEFVRFAEKQDAHKVDLVMDIIGVHMDEGSS